MFSAEMIKVSKPALLAISAMGGVVTACVGEYGMKVDEGFDKFLREFLSQVRQGEDLEKEVRRVKGVCFERLHDPLREGMGEVWMFFVSTKTSTCVVGAKTLQQAAETALASIAEQQAEVN